jgi:hypothetical protein
MSPTDLPWWGWLLGSVVTTILSCATLIYSERYGSRVANMFAVIFGMASLALLLVGVILAIIWASSG